MLSTNNTRVLRTREDFFFLNARHSIDIMGIKSFVWVFWNEIDLLIRIREVYLSIRRILQRIFSEKRGKKSLIPGSGSCGIRYVRCLYEATGRILVSSRRRRRRPKRNRHTGIERANATASLGSLI